jgi:hypothetical protein
MNGKQPAVDPSYYARLPGAIRGQAPVIYYPSCDPDAYFQPAIINYCTDYNDRANTRDWNLNRSLDSSEETDGTESLEGGLQHEEVKTI